MKKMEKTARLLKAIAWPAIFILTAGVSSPALSENAHQLMQRGIVAADSKEWSTATQYFLEAQKLEPLHPKVLFNLGFSCLNEGRNVPADLWLRAYLGLNPEAPNAAEIRKEIQRLDVSVDATSGKLIEEAITQMGALADPMTVGEREAFQMPADPAAMQGQKIPPDMAQRRKNTLGAILFAQTASGRITEAVNFAARMNLANIQADSLKRYFGQIQADAGDFEGAERTLKEIQNPAERDLLLYSVIISEIASEKLDRAEANILLVSSPKDKVNLLNTLILKYVRQLEVEKAEKFLSGQNLTQEDRNFLLVRIIAGYLKKDMPDKARVFGEEVLAGSAAADSKQLDRVAVALATQGRGTEAVALVQKALAGNKLDERKISETTAFLISALCWSQNLDAAAAFISTLEGAKSPAVRETLKTARPFFLVEKGEIEKAWNAVKEIPSENRDSLVVSLFWRLVQKKLYGDAARMALASDSDLVRSRLFLKLADVVTGPEAAFQKKELRNKAFGWALSAQDVLGLKLLSESAAREGNRDFSAQAGRAAGAMTWIELADYFTRVPATSNLKNHADSFKLKGFDVVPYETALAALEWGRVSVYIRARERNQV